MTSASTAEAVLARCAAAGVTVSVDGTDLVLMPRNLVTPEILAAVRVFKARLIAWLSWDEQAARDALDVVLDRIGRACTDLDGFATDQRRVDLEERINVAGHRRNREAYDAALAEYERHCLAAYGGAAAVTQTAAGEYSDEAGRSQRPPRLPPTAPPNRASEASS